MHQPGKIDDRRGKTPAQPRQTEEKIGAYFDPKTFVPARGYALIEFRFIGTSELHIPDEVHAKQQFGIVRAMGEGKLHFNGTIIPPEWGVGDFVYAATAQGRRIELGEQKLVLIGTEHIFGKFPEVPQVVIDEFARELEKGKLPEPKLLDSNGNAP